MDTPSKPSLGQGALLMLKGLVVGRSYYGVMVLANVGLSLTLALLPGFKDLIAIVVGVAAVAVLLALNLGVPALRKTWTSDYEAATAEELIALLHFYYPSVLNRLSKLVASSGAGGVGEVEDAVLQAASSICGPSQLTVRAVLFEQCNGELRQKPDRISGGRPSDRVFRSNGRKEPHKTAWEVARTGEPVTYHDVLEQPPPGFEAQGSPYRSFMTCGILDPNGGVLGMLNVDVSEAGVFIPVDEKVLKILCLTLSVAYGTQKR